jgi:hypothetical protein
VPRALIATKEACSAGGSIHYAVFFCTDGGFSIEMVLLDGKDKHRLLWDWMDALEKSMAREGGPAIPEPLTPRSVLIVCQQQGLRLLPPATKVWLPPGLSPAA